MMGFECWLYVSFWHTTLKRKWTFGLPLQNDSRLWDGDQRKKRISFRMTPGYFQPTGRRIGPGNIYDSLLVHTPKVVKKINPLPIPLARTLVTWTSYKRWSVFGGVPNQNSSILLLKTGGMNIGEKQAASILSLQDLLQLIITYLFGSWFFQCLSSLLTVSLMREKHFTLLDHHNVPHA